MRSLLLSCFALVLLFGCDSRPAATTAREKPAPPPAASAPVASPAPPRRRRDTLDVSSLEYVFGNEQFVADTLLRLGTRHYRLHLQAQPDSSQEIKALLRDQIIIDSAAVGSMTDDHLALAAKRYYNVHYSIALLDSAGRPQFRRTFTKPDFYKLVGRELGYVDN